MATLTGNEDHDINLSTASDWTANYRATISTGDVIAQCFGKAAVIAILSQTDCVGLRIYYALDDEGAKQVILCGVNADGDDLYNGLLAEHALKSPPFPMASNPLNS